ncbi:50S ribosomal protein L18 [Vallitalea pronyensis]|uniref:Large ribosomal subunit protein uL18 n=1 Tax=Vallitalea pronyensis TaxID=1348613 RepID=A0A8J8SFR0_9FIRM|nr:50S ribosomal protein L18 [Vallitalea pronyensis]QUI21493.1 50S ribosomal protein L18 [Vallitalea pronyensis]
MIKKVSRSKTRAKKHLKIRNKIVGTAERPRLAVYRSDKHMYAQIIDDVKGHTMVSASTIEKAISEGLDKTNNVSAAALVGETIGKKAVEKGITEVVFDRGGYIYQGKVKALADSAREAGLKF